MIFEYYDETAKIPEEVWRNLMAKMKPKSMSKSDDMKSDKKMVKSGVHQHESNMHKGKKPTKLKLGK